MGFYRASKPQAGPHPVWQALLGRRGADEIRSWFCTTCHFLPISQLLCPKSFCLRIAKSRKGHSPPSVSDPGEDEQSNTNHHQCHHNPKNNQPYGDRRLVRGSQCRLNTQKLQAVVVQAENIIDTAPRHPVPKSKTLRQKGHWGKIKHVIIFTLYHCS